MRSNLLFVLIAAAAHLMPLLAVPTLSHPRKLERRIPGDAEDQAAEFLSSDMEQVKSGFNNIQGRNGRTREEILKNVIKAYYNPHENGNLAEEARQSLQDGLDRTPVDQRGSIPPQLYTMDKETGRLQLKPPGSLSNSGAGGGSSSWGWLSSPSFSSGWGWGPSWDLDPEFVTGIGAVIVAGGSAVATGVAKGVKSIETKVKCRKGCPPSS